jgi:diaminohydroxyphosphoribosylaminopyrimidine deaminase/5-amino-6-(5-phosphoribosylamino)uracil reductase
LIQAQVQRVVVACPDPNPRAAGGLERLAANGIAVEVGLLQEGAAAANERFLTAMKLKRPRIVLKAAMSLDGRIALPSGESKWLTAPDARAVSHRLRAESGAVLVGRKTVEADDPLLTARIPGVVNQPVRIVLDPYGKLQPHWRVFDSSAPTIHVVNGKYGFHAGTDGFDLGGLCRTLFEEGITGVLVEGGAYTAGQFMRSGLVDAAELFVAPKLLGSGPAWMDDLGVKSLAEAPRLSVTSLKMLKADVQISLRVERGNFEVVHNDIGV